MNVHWMVFYKFDVFCSDMKFKMTATAGFSLTLDPMGKMFQNASWTHLHNLRNTIFISLDTSVFLLYIMSIMLK
jgi:hypothetical protein